MEITVHEWGTNARMGETYSFIRVKFVDGFWSDEEVMRRGRCGLGSGVVSAKRTTDIYIHPLNHLNHRLNAVNKCII